MNPVCPYCNKRTEIDHSDGYGYDEDVTNQQTCGNCNNTFIYYTTILFSYDLYEAECLNGGDHDYVPQTTSPKSLTKMVCHTCGDQRLPTGEERDVYNIPTIEDDPELSYINSI